MKEMTPTAKKILQSSNPKNPNTDNVPALRFPEFKDEWVKKKLGEVADFKVTNSFSRENLNYEEGTVKNVHYGDIHTKFQTLFDITKEDVPYINEEISISRISEDFYCKEGDLIFADASEDLHDVGKSIEITNLNNEKLLSGLHTLLARPKENYFAIGFNGYLFKSYNVRSQIQKEAQGSKVLSINVGRISKIELTFPSLPEQTRIASFLTTVDKKLTQLKQKKSLLEQYKKGVMQRCLNSDSLDLHDERDFENDNQEKRSRQSSKSPKSRFRQLRFKDENGKEFSKWEKKKLGEIAVSLQSGKDKPNNQEGFPVYGSMGIIGTNSTFSYTTENILIARVGANAGTLNIIKGKYGVSDNTLVLVLNENSNLHFIYYLLVSLNLNRLVFGSGQPLITGGHVKSMIIDFPCIDEQNKIANFFSAIDKKINQTETQIKQSEQYKKSLLQKMFV